MSKKLISLLLSLLLVLGAVGVPVGAATGDPVTLCLYNSMTEEQIDTIPAEEGKPYTFYMNNVSKPTMTGYDFIGWSATKGGTTKIDMTSDIPSGGSNGVVFLYAIWEAKDVNVTFYNGYGGTIETKTLKFDGNYILPTQPTRTGHTFNGWYTSGGTRVTDSTKVSSATDHPIYAQWTTDTYTVELFDNINGNGTSTTPDRTLTVAYGKKVDSIAKPTRTGYTCTWTNKDSGAAVSDDTAITSSMKLSAVWTANQYDVYYNTTGGSFPTPTPAPGKFTYDTPLTSCTPNPTPELPGYTFKGWSTSAEGSIITDTDLVKGVTTLYALWTANTYKLTLDYNYPSDVTPTPTPAPIPTVDVTFGQPYGTALPSPTPAPLESKEVGKEYKYTFAGWYDLKSDKVYSTEPEKNETGKEITARTVVETAKNHSIFARWGYEIEFFANNTADPTTETPIGTLKCVTGKAYDVGEMPKEPTRAGYTFAGWYNTPKPVETDKPVTLDAFTPADAKNKTLYAHWTNASYQVTLDPNGGALVAGTSDKIDVKYQEAYPALPNPAKRKGYTFDGWYTAKDGGTKVTSETKFEATDNETVLYAHWKAEKATLTVDYQLPADFDNTDNKYPPLTGKLDIGQELSVAGLPKEPAPYYYGDPKIKFEFDEWYTTQNDSNPDNKGSWVNPQTPLTADMVDDHLNITLYARWSMPVGLCNNYDGKATETTRPDSTVKFVIGSVYGDKLPTPTRTGYTFMGWFTTPSVGGVQKTATDIAEREFTKLYARWTTSAYVVTLDPTDGAFSEEQKIRSKEFNHNDPYGDFLTKYIPTAPAGHKFDGWYTEKEGGRKLTASDRVTKGGTIYAHWKADQFKVTLKLNYSGAADTVKTVDYGTELKKVLPASEPERAGYAFLGWFTDESFTTPADPEEKIAANMTIYAQWKEGKRVDLVVGGGKLPENTHSYIYVYDGGTFNKLPTPTWPGCIFGGWWTAATGGEQVTVVTPAGANPPAALYARWTPKQVIVHLDYNGAPNLPSLHREYSIGSPYTGLPTYASWPGHEFMGWYTKSAGGEKIESSTLVSVASDEVEEFTIYAHWGYKVSFDPMEGTGEMDQQTAEMNQPYTLPTCTFTPPDGMRFGGWAIGTPDGPKQAGGSQYTVNRHLTLYATWTTAPIVITSSCTPGGSLMTEDGKANEVTVERGTDVTFVAAANTGYVLKELLVDGVNFNYTDVYTFRNVIEDHVIHAVFVPEGAPAYSTCGHGSSCPLSKYQDMTPGAWYHDGVHFCIDNVIMGGTGDGVFSPNSRATRAEVATTLWNYAGRPPIAGSGALPRTYKDVKPSAWYYQAVEWATKEGLLSGYGDSTFRPNNYITREELVSILWHHAGQPKARQTGLRFYDAWQVSNWAWDAMLWATEEGVISGRSFGYLVPKGTATRAEVATMLKNYLG